MSICSVKWRPSGGRGEYEVVPADALVGLNIILDIPQLKLKIPTETRGTSSQGKPRVRKFNGNDRSKLHLVPLVLAIARLPDPAREDTDADVIWPLENKSFLVSETIFKIVSYTQSTVTLTPISAKILHTDITIDLVQRLDNIANDIADIEEIRKHRGSAIADSIASHFQAISSCVNSIAIRDTAAELIRLQAEALGPSNTATFSTIDKLEPTDLEEGITGVEGRILTRLHSFRERDRKLIVRAKGLFKLSHGKIFCECCGIVAGEFYGSRGEDRIQAHHRTPVEQLLPDSITTPKDLAMVCPNCHDIIHAERPWIAVEELHSHLQVIGNHYF